MNRLMFAFAAMTLVSASLVAAPRTGRSNTTTRLPSESGWTMNAGAALAIGGGSANPGFSVGVGTRVSQELPLYVGGDLSTFFVTGNQSAVILGVLPAAYFQFSVSDTVHPFAGMELGPVFGIGDGADGINFGMFFKPGVIVNLTETFSLHGEARLGVVASTFTFIPQIGAAFAL